MTHMEELAAEVTEARENALELAMRIHHPDPDEFADRMVEAWLKGRVDRWIIEREPVIYGTRSER